MTTDDSPTGRPPSHVGHVVMIDGEPYVRLRHVHSLFEHTPEGLRWVTVRRRWFTWERHRRPRLMLWEEHEERPSTLLDKEFGPLPK